MQEIAIQFENVKKEYRLGQIGGGTLKGDLQSRMARMRGKEDPNSKIGAAAVAAGEKFLALDGISFTVKKGEAVGIIGHNGAGKSTLLKLLCRVTGPTSGTIRYTGRVASMLEVGTGFHPEMTGRENIYMNGAILGMTRAEIDAKIEDIIEFSEVRQFIDTPVKRYSSGMYVKLAFSVAAHLDSEIMIMDEVLAVGDMAFQKKCLTKMREAASRQGRTVLYVSHNMNTIRQLCDRVIVLDHGRVVFDGDVEEGIGVYMGTNDNVVPKVLLDLLPREEWAPAKEARIQSFEILKKEKAVFEFGEKLLGRLIYQGEVTIDKANLRIVIEDPEGVPVTMVMTSESFTIKRNELLNMEIDLDISQFVPGRYYLSFILYKTNGYGNYECVDWLHNVSAFEIRSPEGFNHGIPWRRNVWGSICLKNFKVRCY